MKLIKKPMVWLLIGVALVSASLILAACAPAATPTEAPTEVVVVVATEAPTEAPTPEPVDQSMYHDAMAARIGEGMGTYTLGRGPNDYCSRCHSPQNWNPESQPGPSPNCIVCKFPTDDAVREVDTMNFVAEADWVGIPCETCHEVDANGVASDEISWLNPITLSYEVMSNSTELCEKCHITSSGVMFSGGRGASHKIEVGGSAHMKYAGEWPQADRPQFCADCHDPHSGVAKTCQECHTDIADSTTHMKGHNADMLAKVECMACHDSSGMDVGPYPGDDSSGIFTTLVSSVGRSGPTTEAVYSHSIQWLVNCDRCHFDGNEWELPVLTADGEIPSDDAGAGGPP